MTGEPSGAKVIEECVSNQGKSRPRESNFSSIVGAKFGGTSTVDSVETLPELDAAHDKIICLDLTARSISLRRDVLDPLAENPLLPERVAEPVGPVAVEPVGERGEHLGARGHGTLAHCVDIGR